MAQEQVQQHVVVSWDELHRDARTLSRRLIELGTWNGIVAITRGGLIPAALVARELDIRLVDTVCVVGYQAPQAGAAATSRGDYTVLKRPQEGGPGWLLIDDLVDTGGTARRVRELLPGAFFATLYAKPAGRPVVDLCIREFPQDTWINFPWDIEYRFAPPIKESAGLRQDR